MITHSYRSHFVRFALLSLSFMMVVAGHSSERANRVNVIRAPGDAKVVKAQLGADRAIHLPLDAEDGPPFVKSTNAGGSSSAPMTMVGAASQKPGPKFRREALAVGRDGRVP